MALYLNVFNVANKFIKCVPQPNVPQLFDNWLKKWLKREAHPILGVKEPHFWVENP